ncbi:MAG: peptide chain release factor N(5)-glutamine methyltransferase [Clostridiales Family XIII bacterium]|nr:peptide chain release factor N(5)-glutamine methyltransferase [Clostridiales Family XIII bacterium]
MGLQIKEIIAVAEKILRENGVEDYKADAEILLCHEIRYDSRKIFMNWSKELDDEACERYFADVQRRAAGTPTQYLTEMQPFMGFNFSVDERVLIPRMDTETVVESAIEFIRSQKSIKNVLDLCTGSGVIAISLAKAVPSLKLTATDISGDALAVAAKNASRLGVSARIKFLRSDLFNSLPTGFTAKKFDMIIANPPYIRTAVLPRLQREIYEHEPLIALDGGEDGLDYYRAIATRAPSFLTKRGVIFFEIGYDQAEDVSDILRDTGNFAGISVRRDIAGNDRVVFASVK